MKLCMLPGSTLSFASQQGVHLLTERYLVHRNNRYSNGSESLWSAPVHSLAQHVDSTNYFRKFFSWASKCASRPMIWV